MYPGGAPFGNRALPPRSAPHEIVETEMAEFMTAVRGKDHIAGGRGRDKRSQCFEPANDASTPLSGRLPPRAAWRLDHQWRRGVPVATQYDDHVAGSCRNVLTFCDHTGGCSGCRAAEHGLTRLARHVDCWRAVRMAEL